MEAHTMIEPKDHALSAALFALASDDADVTERIDAGTLIASRLADATREVASLTATLVQVEAAAQLAAKDAAADLSDASDALAERDRGIAAGRVEIRRIRDAITSGASDSAQREALRYALTQVATGDADAADTQIAAAFVWLSTEHARWRDGIEAIRAGAEVVR